MNLTTKKEGYPALTSLVISPNLQALLEFDDRLRESSRSHNQPEVPTRAQHPIRYPSSWREQEVPTISLPPPRRRKKSGVQAPPKTISPTEGVSSMTKTLPGAGEFGRPEEVAFIAIPEDIPEETEESDLRNPYLNSPPSPRYLHQRFGEGDDHLSVFYPLEKSRSVRQSKRQRSLSDQSQGGQSPSSFFTVGPRQRERGKVSVSFELGLCTP